ncbi:MAG: hypothetical protein OXD29_14135 [Roseovarius sp.]|nr:hypothetical protein [Roseovarius sp.]MCY4209069.1 hypothetical protein [Roseovarius sp.]MCY4290598.1 hypothetical protein [Roseovarius sp.]MCY4315682.1 hypothetical protein [Roseovarius sp.]
MSTLVARSLLLHDRLDWQGSHWRWVPNRAYKPKSTFMRWKSGFRA